MRNSLTDEPITVETEGGAGPFVMVPRDQVQCVTEILDRADIPHEVSRDALKLNDDDAEDVINLGKGADPAVVQRLLDDAVVRVSITLVDGGSDEYYQNAEFIERYESLAADGLKGKALVHELITNDWGAPPVGIKLEGRDRKNRRFQAYIEYR